MIARLAVLGHVWNSLGWTPRCVHCGVLQTMANEFAACENRNQRKNEMAEHFGNDPATSRVEVEYTNHKGVRRWRTVGIVRFAREEAHWYGPGKHMILFVYDVEKKDHRSLLLTNIHGFRHPGTVGHGYEYDGIARDRRAIRREHERYELFRGPEREHLARYKKFILENVYPEKSRADMAVELDTLIALATQSIANQYFRVLSDAMSLQMTPHFIPNIPVKRTVGSDGDMAGYAKAGRPLTATEAAKMHVATEEEAQRGLNDTWPGDAIGKDTPNTDHFDHSSSGTKGG